MDKKHLMRSQIDFQSNTVDSYSNEIATTKFLLLKDLLSCPFMIYNNSK